LGLRSEHISEQAGLRYRIVEEQRRYLPPKPIRRYRTSLRDPDPDELMTRLDGEHAAMAERVLREGARGWKRSQRSAVALAPTSRRSSPS
jgi:hypothetical protein